MPTSNCEHLYVPDLSSPKRKVEQDDGGNRQLHSSNLDSMNSSSMIQTMNQVVESRDEAPPAENTDKLICRQHPSFTLKSHDSHDALESDNNCRIQADNGPDKSATAAPSFQSSPFLNTLKSLVCNKSMPEQNMLLQGLALDLLQEVDVVHVELQQVHKELMQREQLIQDLREECKVVRKEHQCKLLGMAQAVSELDQQQAVFEVMKKLEVDEVVSGPALHGLVIQQLTSKVEDLELENTILLERLSGRKETGRSLAKSLWRRQRQEHDSA